MAEATSVIALLRRAAELYDGDQTLPAEARHAWRRGFGSAAAWMALALSRLGHPAAATDPRDFHRLGVIKYAAATAAMLLVVAVGIMTSFVWPIVLSPLAFYLVEAQMLFLFPVALGGSPTPFRDGVRLTRRAGGTIAAMRIVIPLAAVMLLGGFAGRGFVRCWCLGCLAVCVWYVDLVARPVEAT